MMLSALKHKAYAIVGLATCIAISSCSDDKEETPSYNVPETYSFANVDYSGQEQRIAMLGEIDTYLKRGNNGEALDAQKLKNMYANSNAPYSDANLNAATSKQLKNKTISVAVAEFESMFDKVAAASQSAGALASNGRAGILISTTDPSKKYLVDANGVEYGQVISKGLMGAVFYNQVVEGYLTAAKIGPTVDNTTVTPNVGTAMEHHWDEGFGYFGAPKDFPTNTTGLKYWANYSNKVNAAIGSNKTIMDAFIKGRAAISAKDMAGKDAAAAIVRNEWERLVAASAILELNAAKKNLTDRSLKSHYLSEALGFVMGLKYKGDRKLSDAKYNEVMAKIGTNFYNTTGTDIAAAVDIISAAYNLDNVKAQL
ncbi:hypothetical protein ABID22_000273 [Pontibacter aydingkolensis]|uniref:DUF4856 domain-containing protein n=1 Tax=Pontibacter aydingkolensis TaxID=1911536 RepID=A0ABS7CQE4_9BACT|nr:DUF4856 domain-containing protein [Pontibacter aydingkolensis]MBW7466061.1 DUF4856 domain-containing protein [Pontibacter aydingkolensis]